MIRAWVFGILLGLVPVFVGAAPLGVRSGEHAGFTRLVVDLVTTVDWALVQDGRDVWLTVAGQTDGFDTARAFARISQARVARLDGAGPDRLVVQLACDCIAQGFLLRGRMLVVDVRARRRDEPIPVPEPEASGSGALAGGPAPQPHPALRITLPLRTSVVSTGMMTRMMRTDLDAAVAAGLISAQSQMRIERADTPRQPVQSASARRPDAEQDSRAYCPAGIDEATSVWATDLEYSEGMSRLRAGLFDLTGKEVDGARLDLARFYVAHGAGVEALSLLNNMGRSEAVLVRAMAQVLDRPGQAPERAFVDCPGLSIWEVMRLSRQRAQAAGSFETESLIVGFRGLSQPLQNLFEAEVLRFLSAHGYRDAEGSIAAFRERTHAPQNHMALIDGEPQPLPKQINEDEVLQKVLARFSSLEGAGAASAQERDMVATFRHEYRDTMWSADLWQADVRLHLASLDFDTALDLARAGRGAFPQAFESLYPEMLRHVTDAADDIAFLKIALAVGAGEAGLPVPTADVAEYMHRRMTLLGF